jgi:hypothetical protein
MEPKMSPENDFPTPEKATVLTVKRLFDDLARTATPQGWREAPPPSAASALTRRGRCQAGFDWLDAMVHAHCHGVFVRMIALRMPRRRRMHATSATFFGRPRSTRLL